MFIKEKRKATILRVRAAVLVVLLIADGRTLAAGLSLPVKHAEMQVVANPAPDSACQALLNAGDKLFTMPFHIYMTQASAEIENGKPMSSEMVFAGSARYVLFNG